jgi:chromosome segregation ATPase
MSAFFAENADQFGARTDTPLRRKLRRKYDPTKWSNMKAMTGKSQMPTSRHMRYQPDPNPIEEEVSNENIEPTDARKLELLQEFYKDKVARIHLTLSDPKQRAMGFTKWAVDNYNAMPDKMGHFQPVGWEDGRPIFKDPADVAKLQKRWENHLETKAKVYSTILGQMAAAKGNLTVLDSYLRRFHNFLRGRPDIKDIPKLRKAGLDPDKFLPLTTNEEVRNYLEAFSEAKKDFYDDLGKMRMRGPGSSLRDMELYFKYIVDGDDCEKIESNLWAWLEGGRVDRIHYRLGASNNLSDELFEEFPVGTGKKYTRVDRPKAAKAYYNKPDAPPEQPHLRFTPVPPAEDDGDKGKDKVPDDDDDDDDDQGDQPPPPPGGAGGAASPPGDQSQAGDGDKSDEPPGDKQGSTSYKPGTDGGDLNRPATPPRRTFKAADFRSQFTDVDQSEPAASIFDSSDSDSEVEDILDPEPMDVTTQDASQDNYVPPEVVQSISDSNQQSGEVPRDGPIVHAAQAQIAIRDTNDLANGGDNDQMNDYLDLHKSYRQLKKVVKKHKKDDFVNDGTINKVNAAMAKFSRNLDAYRAKYRNRPDVATNFRLKYLRKADKITNKPRQQAAADNAKQVGPATKKDDEPPAPPAPVAVTKPPEEVSTYRKQYKADKHKIREDRAKNSPSQVVININSGTAPGHTIPQPTEEEPWTEPVAQRTLTSVAKVAKQPFNAKAVGAPTHAATQKAVDSVLNMGAIKSLIMDKDSRIHGLTNQYRDAMDQVKKLQAQLREAEEAQRTDALANVKVGIADDRVTASLKDDLAKAKQDEVKLKAKLDKAESEVATARTEAEGWRGKADDVERAKNDLELQLAELRNQHKSDIADVKRAATDSGHKTAKAQLETQILKLQTDLDGLHEQLSARERENRELSTLYSTTQAGLKDMEMLRKENEKLKQEAESRLVDLKRTWEAELRAEFEEERAKIIKEALDPKYATAVKNYEANLARIKALEDQLQPVKNSNAKLSDEINRLRKEQQDKVAEAVKAESDAAAVRLAEADAAAKKALERAVEKQKSDDAAALFQKQHEVRNIQASLDIKIKELEAETADKDAKARRISELMQDLLTNQGVVADLQRSIKEKEAIITRMNSARQNASNLETQVSTLQSQLQSQIETAKTTAETYEERITNFQSQLERAVNELNTATSNVTTMESEKQLLQQEVAKLQASMEGIKKSAEESWFQTKASLEGKVKAQEQRLNTAQASLKRVTKELNVARRGAGSLNAQISTLQEQKRELQETLGGVLEQQTQLSAVAAELTQSFQEVVNSGKTADVQPLINAQQIIKAMGGNRTAVAQSVSNKRARTESLVSQIKGVATNLAKGIITTFSPVPMQTGGLFSTSSAPVSFGHSADGGLGSTMAMSAPAPTPTGGSGFGGRSIRRVGENDEAGFQDPLGQAGQDGQDALDNQIARKAAEQRAMLINTEGRQAAEDFMASDRAVQEGRTVAIRGHGTVANVEKERAQQDAGEMQLEEVSRKRKLSEKKAKVKEKKGAKKKTNKSTVDEEPAQADEEVVNPYHALSMGMLIEKAQKYIDGNTGAYRQRDDEFQTNQELARDHAKLSKYMLPQQLADYERKGISGDNVAQAIKLDLDLRRSIARLTHEMNEAETPAEEAEKRRQLNKARILWSELNDRYNAEWLVQLKANWVKAGHEGRRH